MHVADYVAMAAEAEEQMAASLLRLTQRRHKDADVRDTAKHLATWSEADRRALEPFARLYGALGPGSRQRVRFAGVHGKLTYGLGELRDLQDVALLASHVETTWVVLQQVAKALHDKELEDAANAALGHVRRQHEWLTTLIRHKAPQALLGVPQIEAACPAPVR